MICYFKNYNSQQMNRQKSIFSKAIDNLNNVKTKISINNLHLQSLKQKIMYQSQKISALKYTGPSSYNSQINDNVRKKNRSNDYTRRHHPMHDSMLQKKERKGSEANTMIQLYLSSKQPSLHKNKSQLFQFHKQSPMHQHQPKLSYHNHARSAHEETVTQQRSFNLQHINQPLKLTTSTAASSPTLLKTIEKIKNMVEAGQLSLKCSVASKLRQRRQLKIKDFQIIRYIQEGQFGAVYLAKHIATNFICAIKKIPKHIFGGDPRYINQLIRQVKIQSFLEHPNIIHLYACFDDFDHVYLMMQYCSGGNLYNSLKKQIRFSEQKVRKYLRQICHAVQYMHDHDIIHRDIKPQNILLHHDMAKICDFGWSINSPLLRETHCGTPLYSSPQMIERKQYDSKVDIWNIGVMTYQFLYGKVPFQIRRQEDLIKIVQDDIYFSKHHPVSPAAKDFILKCLQKNPNQRFSINKLIDHQFFRE